MPHGHVPHERHERRAHWAFAVAALCWVVLAGCSVESRYRTMSFLFDGVEHPDSVRVREERAALARARAESLAARAGSLSDGRGAGAAQVYVHPPYEDGDCTYCHQTEETGRRFAGAVELNEPVQTLCVGCHDDKSSESLSEEYAWLHGPAAAGQCTGCHSPHQSMYPFLLKMAPGPALCLRCHDAERLATTVDHDAPRKMPCLDCHGPHGSSARGVAPGGEEARVVPQDSETGEARS